MAAHPNIAGIKDNNVSCFFFIGRRGHPFILTIIERFNYSLLGIGIFYLTTNATLKFINTLSNPQLNGRQPLWVVGRYQNETAKSSVAGIYFEMVKKENVR